MWRRPIQAHLEMDHSQVYPHHGNPSEYQNGSSQMSGTWPLLYGRGKTPDACYAGNTTRARRYPLYGRHAKSPNHQEAKPPTKYNFPCKHVGPSVLRRLDPWGPGWPGDVVFYLFSSAQVHRMSRYAVLMLPIAQTGQYSIHSAAGQQIMGM